MLHRPQGVDPLAQPLVGYGPAQLLHLQIKVEAIEGQWPVAGHQGQQLRAMGRLDPAGIPEQELHRHAPAVGPLQQPGQGPLGGSAGLHLGRRQTHQQVVDALLVQLAQLRLQAGAIEQLAAVPDVNPLAPGRWRRGRRWPRANPWLGAGGPSTQAPPGRARPAGGQTRRQSQAQEGAAGPASLARARPWSRISCSVLKGDGPQPGPQGWPGIRTGSPA